LHELAVTEDILKTAVRHAEKANAKRVRQVNIVIGGLAGYVNESLEFYWEIMAAETICRNSRLHFEKIPAKFSCLTCNAEFSVEAQLAFCPQCGSHDAKLLRGNEFYIHSIDVDTDADAD
jgi:hydrogenase nickel incorporation protein HypA/HybF